MMMEETLREMLKAGGEEAALAIKIIVSGDEFSLDEAVRDIALQCNASDKSTLIVLDGKCRLMVYLHSLDDFTVTISSDTHMCEDYYHYRFTSVNGGPAKLTHHSWDPYLPRHISNIELTLKTCLRQVLNLKEQ